MASTYTTALRLELPATGDLTGTWGTRLNSGVTQLVEQAIAGRATVVMTDADYTLTALNATSDEARNMVLRITGTLTAARNVICPTAAKLYIVENATTGGFAITLKTSAGTGISVANGQSMLLRCDGTNVVNAFGYFAGTAATATSATTASNLAGGGAGQIPYQSGAGTTAMLAAGTVGQVFTANGAAPPSWTTPAGVSGPITASALTMSSARALLRTTAGTGAIEEATAAQTAAFVSGLVVMRSYIAGLALSTAGASATMTVAAGQAADSANAYLISLAASLAKTTSAWTVGSGNGGRARAAAIATGTWYHFYLIRRTDTGVVDVCFSLSAGGLVSTDYVAGGGNVPDEYTQYRRIGSGRTDGSSLWTKFVQDGDLFMLDTPVLDIDVTNPGTSAVTRTLASVPTGVRVGAVVNYGSYDPGNANQIAAYLSDLSLSNMAASKTAAPLGTNVSQGTSNVGGLGTVEIMTNTSAQIRSRVDASSGTSVFKIATLGWRDSRGRDA